ncbi:6-pyruvoyltetrahydropterin/6-carboxytetrahydropterin synthase [Amphibacillus marinus]|uniref:6-carboxy-5,6,7,8-tetrahydropterin synthase n=1 Tax=Amphibacillus marinus TaxID=872970 RepID=A0A1H8H9M3_9BACI|nr:6-carboxytetrahydropterin synthase QueD [Amphibacillus marinus]SEN52198.1 6-pyruvoyltetrahydropterin/6-carboxytetrahydropterin synthase [Amphibacillus marinus]
MERFKIVKDLQKIDIDIERDELKFHQKRVLVSKSFTFDAAHHLHCYEGKCKTLHGHTYEVIFGVSGYPNEIGLVIDFGDIKKIWKDQIEIHLDHQYLNQSLPKMNTTAENMVVWIFEQMDQFLNELNQNELRVEFVKLYETPTSYAEARREWM